MSRKRPINYDSEDEDDPELVRLAREMAERQAVYDSRQAASARLREENRLAELAFAEEMLRLEAEIEAEEYAAPAEHFMLSQRYARDPNSAHNINQPVWARPMTGERFARGFRLGAAQMPVHMDEIDLNHVNTHMDRIRDEMRLTRDEPMFSRPRMFGGHDHTGMTDSDYDSEDDDDDILW
jgi:hypothetical protein